MISEEAAAVKVPQANVHCVCIVLIGFGSAADFIQSFEKDRKSGDRRPMCIDCVWFWKCCCFDCVLSSHVFTSVFTSEMDESGRLQHVRRHCCSGAGTGPCELC